MIFIAVSLNKILTLNAMFSFIVRHRIQLFKLLVGHQKGQTHCWYRDGKTIKSLTIVTVMFSFCVKDDITSVKSVRQNRKVCKIS